MLIKYHNKPAIVKASLSEVATFYRLQDSVYGHHSGGSFNMMALWNKGSHHILGKNGLRRSASTIADHYPDICGVHAELDLYRKANSLRGGNVYVAGYHENSGTPMDNTQPCVYCSAILHEARVSNVIYKRNGIVVKSNPSNMIGD